MDAMTMSRVAPGCLARAGAIPCRNCGRCDGSAGDGVADVSAGERARVARDHFCALRGLSADAAVTAGARERVARDHANVGCGQCGAASNRSVDDLLGAVFDAMPAAFRSDFRTRQDGVDYLVALSRGRVGSVLSRRQAAPLVGRSLSGAVGRLDIEWANPKTRAEFGNDKEAFVAFRRHELAGDVTIAADKRVR